WCASCAAWSAWRAEGRPRRRRRARWWRPMRRSHAEAALPWIVRLGSALLLECAVRGLAVPEFLLPAPSAIGASMARWWWPLLDSAARTLLNTALGFGLAAGLAWARG